MKVCEGVRKNRQHVRAENRRFRPFLSPALRDTSFSIDVDSGESKRSAEQSAIPSPVVFRRGVRDLLLTTIGLILLGSISSGAREAFAQQPAWGANLFAPSQAAGRTMDTARALPAPAFYREAPLSPSAKPGTLVRAQPATDFELPPGITATRIVYHTQTASGKDTLASGVVLVPYGHAPKGGWPLIAWSHGTSGVARRCAPSLMNSMFYDWEGLFEYVTLGYAVVATDYAGLGVGDRHAYLDLTSNATDVINSISAAHAAVSNLGPRWLVVGHSQGGLSSLGVAELESRIKDQNFLGTIALAGASDLDDAIGSILKTRLPLLNGLVAFWIYGVKSIYPQFDPGSVLTSKALAIYDKSVEDGCSGASGAFTVLRTDEMLLPGWRDNRYVAQFLSRNRPGAQPTYGPILLVSGGDDVLFTEAAGQKIFRRICNAGGHVQRRVYAGLGHDALVYGSLREQLDWIAQRFNGETASNECPTRPTD
jgi:pimeloyl-ACP methyl ester carboxylesterase